MGRFVERTFSGYRYKLPPGLRIFVRDREGNLWRPKESMFGDEYWMRIKMVDIAKCYEQEWQRV